VALVDGADGEHAAVVLVAHPAEVDITALERAARALVGGARLLTASYVPAYAGADGPIFSRGAMVTAAIAKASGARPVVVGKPSRAAVREIVDRLGVPSHELAVVGDDVALEVVLGKLGGSRTILVRTGISHGVELERLPERKRPDAAIGSVAELLAALPGPDIRPLRRGEVDEDLADGALLDGVVRGGDLGEGEADRG
jgi:ribonucleotide monophosphatase NagD (HAD superfamily)